MAANVQNMANTSVVQQAQFSSSISSQLDNITKILNSNFANIDKYLKKSFHNQNLIYNTMETRHQALEQRFASIEA